MKYSFFMVDPETGDYYFHPKAFLEAATKKEALPDETIRRLLSFLIREACEEKHRLCLTPTELAQESVQNFFTFWENEALSLEHVRSG